MYIMFIFLQKQISPALLAHRTVKTRKGGCPGWQPGMKGWTPLTCLCWELRVTPETTAHLLAASSMASVTQVKVRQLRCDGVTFEKRSKSSLWQVFSAWHILVYMVWHTWTQLESRHIGLVQLAILHKLRWYITCMDFLLQHELYTVYSNSVTMATHGTQLNCWQHSCCPGLWSVSTRPLGCTKWLGCSGTS